MEKIVSDVIKIIKGSKNEIEMEKVLWTFLREGGRTSCKEQGVCRLRGDLTGNWDRQKSHAMRRGSEKSVRCYGTGKKSHRRYSYRMKKEGRRWGKEGCLAMAKVLAGLQNEELEAALFSKFKPEKHRRARNCVRP